MKSNSKGSPLLFLKLILKELLSFQNYVIAFVIGVVINYFQGIGVFNSVVPFIVPIVVQSISKASVKYGNRNLNLLVKLPRERTDPAFVMSGEGLILVCEGKTKELLTSQNVREFSDIFSNNSKEELDECIKRAEQKGDTIFEEIFSPRLGNWYQVYLKVDQPSGNILVWLQNITQRKELDEKLRGLRDFFTTLVTVIDYPEKGTALDQIAVQILNDGYETVFITTEEKGETLVGFAYKLIEGEMLRSELICEEPGGKSAVWASRRKNGLVFRNYEDGAETEYRFHSRLKGFINDPIKNFVNYHEENVSIIAVNKNTVIKKYDALFFESLVHSAFTLIYLLKEKRNKVGNDAGNSMALFARFNPEPVFRFNKEGTILEANLAANSSFGPGNITGRKVKKLLSECRELDIEDFIQNDRTQIITQEYGLKSYRFMLKGISSFGICQIYGSDITEQLKARREAETMALFALMNPEPVFRVDREGLVIQSNDAANSAFTIETGEVVYVPQIISQARGLDFNGFINEDKILTLTEAFNGRIFRFLLRGLKKLGVCQIYSSDVTERVRAEEKVIRQKKNITDSIEYASRIQDAILPSTDILAQVSSEHFVLFQPRDIVSGDFYWVKESGERVIVVAADCTGHGVPGAFMSMLGVAFLNEIMNNETSCTSASILEELRLKIKDTLSQSGTEGTPDGMDLSLVILEKNEKRMQYSGAYNHLYLVRDGELEVIRADKMPIGNYHSEERPFTLYDRELQKGDVIYLFSDGYRDQFSRADNAKIGTKRFKGLLLANHKKTMAEQHRKLQEFLDNWKGDKEQVDDILVVGIRV